ncbi:mechanosensitive ion channel family protein [Dactylococcopsis salina]|uniref:Small-conductance mechanosensitive channel n=1 Tax=Dactylococcopsis salina (strain PCC 8305) TaxID=13035 RepID=K9YUG8_DACS8|nr:mechanosensitive ion channel domain-containing protein [Dactylococcopsis salina]AFZ50571.1 small-conductance mechanosensitive channel [Dactylococcopsis salina PCC 8305]
MVQIEWEILQEVLVLMLRLGLFSLAAIISPFVGRFFPQFIWRFLQFIQRYVSIDAKHTYDQFVKSFQNLIAISGTFLFLALALNLLAQYEEIYQFLGFFIYFCLSVTLAWIALKISRQLIRRTVISLVQRWFGEVSEVVLIFESLIYVVIIILAGIIFAIGLRLNITAIVASLGISGVAIAFGAQQTLSRLFGTLEIYLDRPYRPGEYIRINFNPYDEDAYGRIESIGLRSTKIRLVARNTITIVPNSLMADKRIENVSRGKKIVAMLCLDFLRVLDSGERALVKQVVQEASEVFWGFTKASIHVQYCASDQQAGTRARIIFFISSVDESSLGLRKRLLELANSAIAHKLAGYNLKFTTPEPVVYIDSPMSL